MRISEVGRRNAAPSSTIVLILSLSKGEDDALPVPNPFSVAAARVQIWRNIGRTASQALHLDGFT